MERKIEIMANLKNCEVLLVSQVPSILLSWIEKIKSTFENVNIPEVRKCFFEEETNADFRVNIRFTSTESKVEIYKKMNQIKANPIKFIS